MRICAYSGYRGEMACFMAYFLFFGECLKKMLYFFCVLKIFIVHLCRKIGNIKNERQ